MKLSSRNYIHAALLVISFVSVRAQAEDVYNFYFQKPAEAAKPKVQVEPELKATPQPVEAKTPQTEVSPTVQKESSQGTSRLEMPTSDSKEYTFHRWEISFGRSVFGEEPQEFQGYHWQSNSELSRSEWNLGVQYNMAHHLACDFEIKEVQGESLFAPSNFGFALGMSYMPLRFDLIAKSYLDLGIIAGATSVPIQNGHNYDDYAPSPDGTPYSVPRSTFIAEGISQKFLPYYGAKLALYVGKGVSIVGSAKMIPGYNEAQMTGAISIGL